jgi:transposase
VHRNAPMTARGRMIMIERIRSGRPIAHVAAEMGVSRKTADKWWRRWLAEGEAGLEDRSSRPRRCPHQTAAHIERRIVRLRQRRKLGPARIASIVGMPASTVHRVLVRHGLNRLAWMDRPTGQVIRRIHTDRPGELVSKIDSRTILGEMGAEQLLGQGDMLYMAGGGRISRVHGPFVSDEEVEKVVRHLKTQGQPEYLEAVTAEEPVDEEGAVFDSTGMGGDGGGDLFSQAVAIVKRDRKASTSYIQRRLQIGYNRAASLMERMELEGIVGQANHAGKREILIEEEESGF